MKIGIIADIHSNFEAFKAVLEKLGGVEKIYCLGDIVGYGPSPNECVELVRQRNIESIAGNHDWAVSGKIDISLFNPYAAEAICINQRILSEENKNFLGNLPTSQTPLLDTFLVHGSPREPILEYIFDENTAALNFTYFTQRVCFVGHTHRPVVFEKTKGKVSSLIPEENQVIKLKRDTRYIINPGAVGQPRDGNPKASFLVFDNENFTVEFKRVSYPLEITQEKMRHLNFPEFLIQRLSVGK